MVPMTDFIIPLPSESRFKDLSSLIDLLSSAHGEKKIILDFTSVGFYSPPSLVTILATAKKWVDNGSIVKLRNHKSCSASRYLQRMDFFNVCGVSVNEKFKRHSGTGRFITIQDLNGKTQADIDSISEEVARCIAPDMASADHPDKSGFYDSIQYAVSEISLNVVQHSVGRGFLCAQYYPGSETVEIGIADNGIGIKASFKESLSSHYNEKMSDGEAVRLALKSKVSSKGHQKTGWGSIVNAGVGIPLVEGLAKAAEGQFVLCSGDAFYADSKLILLNGYYSGVLCAFSMNRNSLKNLPEILYSIKENLGLIEFKLTNDQQDLFI